MNMQHPRLQKLGYQSALANQREHCQIYAVFCACILINVIKDSEFTLALLLDTCTCFDNLLHVNKQIGGRSNLRWGYSWHDIQSLKKSWELFGAPCT